MNEESACKNMILFDLILGPFGVMEIHSELDNGGVKVDGLWTVDHHSTKSGLLIKTERIRKTEENLGSFTFWFLDRQFLYMVFWTVRFNALNSPIYVMTGQFRPYLEVLLN